MKLYGVRVFVDDLDAARRFYRNTLGLRERWSGPHAVTYDAGTATLIVEAATEGHEALVGRFAGVSFEVDDIDAIHGALVARGVSFWGPPETQDWGGRLAHFRDPAGNTLSLVAT